MELRPNPSYMEISVTEAFANNVSTFLRKCSVIYIRLLGGINPLTANLTKWSNTLKQFVNNVVLILLATLNRYRTMFECSHCFL